MPQPFVRRFRVRHYELDVFGHVSDVSLVRYMQESAIEASTALGCSPGWYQARGVGWVVRRLSVRYDVPVGYGDEVAITTWVSTMRGVRSNREYDVARVGGGRVARGRAEWVFMDAQTAQPTRIPEEWAGAVIKEGLEDLGARLAGARPTPSAHRYSHRRRVQFHELDGARHVNHAVYLRWAGQAYCDALRAAGYPPEETAQGGWRTRPAAHEVQYFAAALDNDPIEVVSWLCELGEGRVAWTHEVSNAETRKLLARDYAVRAFVDAEGRPTALPRQAVEDLLRGPAG
jgi:YbgC/YbaW family acyl-CoA thioester hydrolase